MPNRRYPDRRGNRQRFGTALVSSAPASVDATCNPRVNLSLEPRNPTTADSHWPWKFTFSQVAIHRALAKSDTHAYLTKANQALLYWILMESIGHHVDLLKTSGISHIAI